MTKKTKWIIQSVVVTTILVAWVTYNYTNYITAQANGQHQLRENIAMVDKSTQALEQQKEIRDMGPERRYTRLRDPSGELLYAMPTPHPTLPRDELQDEINALRAEKIRMAREIAEKNDLTNKMSTTNPYINTLAIPLLLFGCTKMIEVGYKVVCKKCGVNDD